MKSKVVICGINTALLPYLTEEETNALLVKIKDGSVSAREEFIVGNMRLVLSIIKRFKLKNASSDDLFQAGSIGLIKAIDNFDLKYGVKFSTYAVPMIIGEIKRLLRDGNSMRVSRSIRDTAYLALKTRGELEKQDKDALFVDPDGKFVISKELQEKYPNLTAFLKDMLKQWQNKSEDF